MRTLAVIFLACLATPAHAEKWQRFTNARFGASVEVPHHLLKGAAAQDMTHGLGAPAGIRFLSDDGVEIAVYGADRRGAEPYRYMCQARCEGETYAVKRPNVAVVSGRRGQFVWYRRCLTSGGTVHCFDIEYPEARAAEFGPVIQRMTARLR